MSATLYDISDRFVQARKRKGLSQKQAAAAFGAGQQFISLVEKGRPPARLWSLANYAAFLEIDIDRLIADLATCIGPLRHAFSDYEVAMRALGRVTLPTGTDQQAITERRQQERRRA